MKKPYKSHAPCGFCEFFGQVFTDYARDVCRGCEIRKMREYLEELAHAELWRHDHKYRADGEEEIHNCAHCEHALPMDTLYHAAQYADEISCWLDAESLGDDESFPVRSALSVCDKWERARGKGR